MDRVNFGNTGLRVSRLSIGTGTNGWRGRSEQTALGLEGLANLLCRAYDAGVTFWDTADEYGSHRHIARALQTIPRDQVIITTKTTARNEAKATQDIERFLRELNTEVLDVILMHCITRADWVSHFSGAMAALSRAKEQGKVRAVGISCHDLGALRTAVSSAWADVVLVRINYDGVNMDGRPKRVTPLIEQLYTSGKAVYGMKILGAGQLTQNPRAAMEYVFKLGTVHAVTIGMNNPEQLREDVRLVEEIAPHYPLKQIEDMTQEARKES